MPQAPVEPKAFNLLVSSISRAVLQMPALRVLMVGIGARGFRGFPKLCWNDGNHDIWIECLDSGEKSAVLRYRVQEMDRSQIENEERVQSS